MTAYAYYNEIDPYAAQWLRNLISAGEIAPGVVDERSIVDVQIEDIRGYTQCHWFAGIGVWSRALRDAGWPDERPVWTGSAPCQPFSNAGKGKGIDDERHLWPAWFRLIKAANPSSLYGEQVASKSGRAWFDIVSSSLESADYTAWAANIAAASVGAPNIRQRLFFTAHNDHGLWYGVESLLANAVAGGRARISGCGKKGITEYCEINRMANPKHKQQQRRVQRHCENSSAQSGGASTEPSRYCETNRMANADCESRQRFTNANRGGTGSESEGMGQFIRRNSLCDKTGSTDPRQTMWNSVDWLGCRDDKFRPVEPGTFPLVDGVANRVGKLRAYGNCINLEAATEFIRASETGRHDFLRFLMTVPVHS